MPSVPRLMIISLITTRDCHSAEEKQTTLPIEKVFTMRTAAIDVVGQHRLECNNCWAMVVAQEWSTLVEERVARAIRSGTTCPRQQHWASLSLNNGLRPSAPGDCQVLPPTHPSTFCSLVAGTWSGTHEMYHGGFLTWHMIMCTLRIQKIKIGN